jgi:hypothetical protein
MERVLFSEKFSTPVREAFMQDKHPNDQDASQRLLAAELAQLVEDELLEMVRTLDDATPATLFGRTEFKIRDLALQIATKAYQQRLAKKKWLRRLQRDLPRMPAHGRVSRRPAAHRRQRVRHPPVSARVLLLPVVRQRHRPV